jgi:hypothetical protein
VKENERRKIKSRSLGVCGRDLLLGIGKNIGVYAGAAEQMQRWHMFFSFSLGGIIAGIIEAAVHSFILGLFFGWLYNSFAK